MECDKTKSGTIEANTATKTKHPAGQPVAFTSILDFKASLAPDVHELFSRYYNESVCVCVCVPFIVLDRTFVCYSSVSCLASHRANG